MIYTITGAAVTVGTCVAYWRLLPRDGRTHPLLKTSDISSLITIGLMTTMTIGIGLVCQGLLG